MRYRTRAGAMLRAPLACGKRGPCDLLRRLLSDTGRVLRQPLTAGVQALDVVRVAGGRKKDCKMRLNELDALGLVARKPLSRRGRTSGIGVLK